MPKPTPEEMRMRLEGISATEISMVAGVSPFGTPLTVFNTKMGRVEPVDETEDIDRGTFLEDGLRDWFAKKSKLSTKPGRTVRSERNPIVIASPDGIVDEQGDPGALELKAPGDRPQGYGDPGTDQVPLHVVTQNTWQMSALNYRRGFVAALIKGRLQIFNLKRDEKLEGALIEMAQKFKRDHLDTKKPPPATAPDLDWLKWAYPTHREDYLTVTEGEVRDLLFAFADAYKKHSAAEDRMLDLRARLEQVIEDRAGIIFEGGRISWKQNKPSIKTDWQAVVVEMRNLIALGASVGVADRAGLLTELDQIAARHTREVPGARPFTTRFNSDA